MICCGASRCSWKWTIFASGSTIACCWSREAREALARLHRDPEGVVHRTAVVLPEIGFLAASIRSIILAATQKAARRAGHHVFQRIDKALTWVTDGLPAAPGRKVVVSDLIPALDQVRKTAQTSNGSRRDRRLDVRA